MPLGDVALAGVRDFVHSTGGSDHLVVDRSEPVGASVWPACGGVHDGEQRRQAGLRYRTGGLTVRAHNVKLGVQNVHLQQRKAAMQEVMQFHGTQAGSVYNSAFMRFLRDRVSDKDSSKWESSSGPWERWRAPLYTLVAALMSGDLRKPLSALGRRGGRELSNWSGRGPNHRTKRTLAAKPAEIARSVAERSKSVARETFDDRTKVRQGLQVLLLTTQFVRQAFRHLP